MIVVRLVVLEYESFSCSSLSCCACIDSFGSIFFNFQYFTLVVLCAFIIFSFAHSFFLVWYLLC